jgi:hypothetical protein
MGSSIEKMKHFLFTTYYQAKSQDRQAEYDFCIEKNKVADFDKIFLFVENEIDLKAAEKFEVEVINIQKRPTFKDFFDFIESQEFSESINIVANTDIFFLNMQQVDRNLHRLIKGQTCFALSRYEYHLNRPSHLFDRPDTQDTWIFNGNQNLSKVQNIDFTMGVAGCDNRLAHELKMAGFEVMNPSRTVQTFHLHDSPIRTFIEGEIQRVPPPYLLLHPTE